MLRTHHSLKAYCATLWWRLLVFFIIPCNGAPVEWNWQGKTEVLGEKPGPVALCPPQIPHGLTRDLTRASAMRGRRLTAWAMARPFCNCSLILLLCLIFSVSLVILCSRFVLLSLFLLMPYSINNITLLWHCVTNQTLHITVALCYQSNTPHYCGTVLPIKHSTLLWHCITNQTLHVTVALCYQSNNAHDKITV
jgi:hypothetical protein